MSQKKLHVVNLIPTYNEKENIVPMLEALERIARESPKYQFSTLVVDDNSPDGTGEIVKLKIKSQKLKIGAKLPNQIYLLSGRKEGLGVALIKGYKYAIDELKADVVVSNDADFLFDPYDIPKLLAKIDEGYDVVIGSRHSDKGMNVTGWPIGRYITHWIANDFFASIVAGTSEVHDHNGDFRAIRVKGILKKIRWDSLPTKGYGFLNYMIYELSKTGASFYEVPVVLKWRERGESKVSFNPKYVRTFVRDTVEYIRLCVGIRLDRLKHKVKISSP